VYDGAISGKGIPESLGKALPDETGWLYTALEYEQRMTGNNPCFGAKEPISGINSDNG